MSNSRVWFITGCTSGFGRALVDVVRARGERVVATARRPGVLADLEGDDVLTLALDVTREDQIEPVLDAAVERFGRVDVLVNKAGIGFVGALEEMSLADLREMMETCSLGPRHSLAPLCCGCGRNGRARSFRSVRWVAR